MLNPSHVLFREDEYLLREDPRVTDEAAYYSLLQAVVDLYDVSDDWVPIYDCTDLDGFYVAIGTSGNQYKNGPVAGHVMAELITAVEGGLDHDNDPLVVEGRYTGMPIEIGFFSRNREAAATSMTVHG